MVTTVLIPELIDYIFSFLRYDCLTLCKCSSAHPFLASLAERHTYVHIAIQNRSTRNDEKFLPWEILKVLDNRPEILTNVQSLSIELIPLSMDEMIDSMRDLPAILSIIASAPRVKSLALKARSSIAWNTLDVTFHAALFKCLASTSLIEVSIHYFTKFPLREVLRCKALTRLSLRGRFHDRAHSHDSITSFQGTSQGQRVELEYLSISYFARPLNVVLWSLLGNLRFLDVSLASPDFLNSALDLLRHCSDSLECLRLDFGHFFRSGYNYPGDPWTETLSVLSPRPLPSSLIRLKRITILTTLAIEASSRQYFSSIPFILQYIAPIVSLQDLRLTLRLRFVVEEEDGLFFFHERDAEYLHNLRVCQPVNLHISVSPPEGENFPPEEVLSALEKNLDLMGMVDSGSLILRAENHCCKNLACCSQDQAFICA